VYLKKCTLISKCFHLIIKHFNGVYFETRMKWHLLSVRLKEKFKMHRR
jgi:hypothetical protein